MKKATIILIAISFSLRIFAQANPFRDNRNGTITDTRTNLMWQKELYSEKMTWENAMKYTKRVQLAGYKDWRLPTIEELKKFLNGHLYANVLKGSLSPCVWLSRMGFKIICNWCWSSTVLESDSKGAWRVDFCNGLVDVTYKSRVGYALFVRSGR